MNYLTSSGLTTVLSNLKSYIDNVGHRIESIKHDVLMEMKFQSKLVPGKFYRITDYTATINKTGYRSAGKQFDIIVLALSENTLAENAWADHHYVNGADQYFPNCNLSAWKIKYSVENNKNEWNIKNYAVYVTGTNFYRTPENDSTFTGGTYKGKPAIAFKDSSGNICYGWSESVMTCLEKGWQLNVYDLNGNGYRGGSTWPLVSQGKGIIYHMEDEWGNECPYDFKNIQMLRNATWITEHYDQLVENVTMGDFTKQDYYCYTFSVFSSGGFTDATIADSDLYYNNKIICHVVPLANIVIMGCGEFDDNEFIDCSDITLCGDSHNNKFDNVWSANLVIGQIDNNIFGMNSNGVLKYGNIFDLMK